jgi:DNA-binding response OmpR family regulator
MDHKVLVVEDNRALLESLEYSLRREGYEVFTAADGRQALEIAHQKRPDLVVLDLMLPVLDGLEVCRILRRESVAPVLILTARTSEADRIVGLEVGADDYMTKPFGMRELLARVRALLRRVRLIREEMEAGGEAASTEALTFGDLAIDLTRCEVRLQGQPLHLTPREFDLLVFLARNRGMALSRDLILQRVWGWEYDGDNRTVDVHVRWLREKLRDSPGNPRRITTVRGIGYRFEPHEGLSEGGDDPTF